MDELERQAVTLVETATPPRLADVVARAVQLRRRRRLAIGATTCAIFAIVVVGISAGADQGAQQIHTVDGDPSVESTTMPASRNDTTSTTLPPLAEGTARKYVGANADGTPIVVVVNVAEFNAKMGELNQRLRSQNPDAHYWYQADIDGNPVPSMRCVNRPATDAERQDRIDRGEPQRMVDLPASDCVDLRDPVTGIAKPAQ